MAGAAPSCDGALGTELLESKRFCPWRRYLSGEAFTGCSNDKDKSGRAEERLINDPGLAPVTESSFAEGCEEVSEELVDTEAFGL